MQRDAEVRALAKEMQRLGRRGQRAVFRPAGRPVRRALLRRPDRHLRQGRTSTSRCCSTGERPRRARSTPPPAPTRRTCAAAASSTPAGVRSSNSPTRSSAGPTAPQRGGGSDAALLAAVNAPRGDGMRDIVATIQAEQDEIIRLDHPGVLVIEGGPGTGKTVVALHRVAYLLYTQRKRIENHGVLVVGPELGVPQPHRPRPAVARRDRRGVHDHRGPGARSARDRRGHAGGRAAQGLAARCLDVLAAAVADRQRLPEQPIPIELADVTVRIDAETARVGTRGGARERTPAQRGPRGVHRDRHVRAHRAGDRADRPRLADPRGPQGVGADAQQPHSRACGQRRVHGRGRRTLADTDAGIAAGDAVLLARAAAGGGRRRGAVPRRRRRLDGVGRAAARRTGRPAGPGQAGRRFRRAGAEGRSRVRRRGAGHAWSAART